MKWLMTSLLVTGWLMMGFGGLKLLTSSGFYKQPIHLGEATFLVAGGPIILFAVTFTVFQPKMTFESPCVENCGK